ncbi:hypothetical protein NDK50_08055 [Paraburkholderia bryophila]|uniref:hypothetical protein n=1 Tax=Paraburkholderia bryophila TaxID=420952 RepID=UPI00234A1D9F|nr:hypothetical protein [Paraburkholderia bryophila]WCM21389.1 hypothetical protein NDK50_08055 [Paraburkholderia bryophila]
MTTPQEVIGYTQREKCALIEKYKLHCSITEFDSLVDEIQRRALVARDEEKEKVE